jgi:hypothetical protein
MSKVKRIRARMALGYGAISLDSKSARHSFRATMRPSITRVKLPVRPIAQSKQDDSA